jgi:hypothetical protein
MTDISQQHSRTTPEAQEQQQSLPGLVVPDMSFRRVIHLVSDAGPLIQALESGIPRSSALIDGLLRIPLARWALSYTAHEARASTLIEASSSSAGSQPFTVRLTRHQDFWGDGAPLSPPRTTYEGAISYFLEGREHRVELSNFPKTLELALDAIESRVQEPAVRDTRRASIEAPAAKYASDMAWIDGRLEPHGEGERSYLPRNCTAFLDDIAKKEVSRWKVADPGDRYEYRGIHHAWLHTFEKGESLALARVDVSFIDQYDNYLGGIATTLIVGSRGEAQRPFHIFLNHEFNPSEFHHRVWHLTEPPKSER